MLSIGFIFVKFDAFWEAEEPENVMAFPQVKTKFCEEFKSDIHQRKVILSL